MLYVVGAGPGDPELMSVKAVKTLERCQVLAGWRSVLQRVISYVPSLANKEVVYLNYAEQEELLKRLINEAAARDVCLVAHGDPTVSDWELLERIRGRATFEVVHSVSSLNVVLGLAGIDAAQAVVVSMHASNPQDVTSIAKCLASERALVVYPPPYPEGPVEVARRLQSAGFGRCRAAVFENLTMGGGLTWRGSVEELSRASTKFSDMCIVVVDCRVE
ncbi:MAG: precorrin-6y C5,15-methyltransferase (decarboxylating) subunit CbiE [Pyrobaculum sp.]